VDIRIARIFNTYGPRMHPFDGRVVSNFIVQALQDREITIYGDGSQTRSFCYVDDLVKGLIRLMESDAEPAEPVNLGNPAEMTIRELAQKIVALSGSRSKLTFRPLPQDDPVRRKPDIRRAGERLDWSPTTALDDGLRRTVEYFGSIDVESYRPPSNGDVQRNESAVPAGLEAVLA
jgi:UDP-glucuronate decarboxylase